MSEKIITCCDYCNKEQSLQPYQGYGVTEMSEQDTIYYLGWESTKEGVMCTECQDNKFFINSQLYKKEG
jgi:hypothetical protein